jgi:hypothetical protein
VPEVTTVTTSESPAASSTELPPATPTSQPSTSTPIVATSLVKGKLIGTTSQKPLAGGTVILCLVSGETQCTLQTDLTATAQEDGGFELTDIPAGQYVVLYEPSGEFKETWEDLDGVTLDYKLTTKIWAKIVAMSLLKKGVMNQTMVRNDQIKKP